MKSYGDVITMTYLRCNTLFSMTFGWTIKISYFADSIGGKIERLGTFKYLQGNEASVSAYGQSLLSFFPSSALTFFVHSYTGQSLFLVEMFIKYRVITFLTKICLQCQPLYFLLHPHHNCYENCSNILNSICSKSLDTEI